jgi:hypothetical protein
MDSMPAALCVPPAFTLKADDQRLLVKTYLLCVIVNTSLVESDLAWDRVRARLGFHVTDNVNAKQTKTDRRYAPRRGYNDDAWIRPAGCFLIRRCKVVDLSRTGVRLTIANAHKIPNKFILSLWESGTGALAHAKWRRGAQIGAEFVNVVNSSTADE